MTAAETGGRQHRQPSRLRGRLHVYESVCDSLYDSMNNLPTSHIGIQFFIRHPLQWSVYTFQPKLIENLIERGLWPEIVHRIVWRFVRKIARVDGDGPLRGRLHVSDSAYELPYDWVHDLHTKGLGFSLSFGHQLQLLVNTYQEKSFKNKSPNYGLVQEIVHGIVCRFVCRIASVDGP
jgi:hypothetical protein